LRLDLARLSESHLLGPCPVLQLILAALRPSGSRDDISWADIAWILLFGTLAGTTVLVGALLHTPLGSPKSLPHRLNGRLIVVYP
jgi:hypothetical protein